MTVTLTRAAESRVTTTASGLAKLAVFMRPDGRHNHLWDTPTHFARMGFEHFEYLRAPVEPRASGALFLLPSLSDRERGLIDDPPTRHSVSQPALHNLGEPQQVRPWASPPNVE